MSEQQEIRRVSLEIVALRISHLVGSSGCTLPTSPTYNPSTVFPVMGALLAMDESMKLAFAVNNFPVNRSTYLSFPTSSSLIWGCLSVNSLSLIASEIPDIFNVRIVIYQICWKSLLFITNVRMHKDKTFLYIKLWSKFQEIKVLKRKD